MKNIFIVAVLSGICIPTLASAELDYNAVDASQSTTSYRNGELDLKELDVGISISISNDMYLQASYGTARQNTLWIYGDRVISSVSLGAGYHRSLMDNTDAFAEGHVILGSAKWAGTSESANGYDMGAGIRAMLLPGPEGTLALVHARTSNGAVSNTDTFTKAQFGYHFTPQWQMTIGMDMKPDETMRIGLRYFY